jgi:aquaporin Z
MHAESPRSVPWQPVLAELVGTFLLVAVGVSLVILDFGRGSPVVAWLPDPGVRRALTGFLFGATGAAIAVSSLGKESGAHINPVVTLAFVLRGRLGLRPAVAYVLAQCVGGALAALPLLLWGPIGVSVQYGATLPGADFTSWQALLGEVATTFGLVAGLFLFVGTPRLRPWTPLLFPFLYAFMVWVEAPLSGTSTNPARSLGPALAASDFGSFWVYCAGPILGALLAVAAHRLRVFGGVEVEVAKLYHFAHDPRGLFRR